MTRTIDAKVLVLRNGAVFSQLFPIAGAAPQIRMDDSGGIPTSLSGDFVDNPEVDWLSDELQPILEIDGVETPLGIFLPATKVEEENSTEKYIHVEAYDRCWKVRDNRTERMLYLPANRNYVTAVTSLLVDCGISIVLARPTSETLPTARQDWPIGTSYLDIINELLSEINYKPLWFNNQGVAMIEPVATPTADQIQHIFDNDNISSLMLPSITKTSDIYSAPNVFLCVCASADRTSTLTARAVNSNPQSPLSTIRRGRRIVEVVNVDNIASQAALNAYANRLLFDSMVSDEIINVQTALLPGFGVNDVVALHYDDTVAICVESAWSMSLEAGGTMTHTLKKVVLNLEF